MEHVMRVDIAIMTIREDEFTAVRRHFQTRRRQIPDGRTYLIGEVKTEKRVYTIAIARCSEQGNDASQRLAHYIIHNLDPQLILVVGIAGGVPRDEFTLGDVVVSSRIVNPNVDAWHPDGTTDYTTRGGPSHPLVDDIISLLPGEPLLAGWIDTIQLERPTLDPEQVNIPGDDEWREKVRQSLNWHFGEEQNRSRLPTFTTGPILSSNHLMKDSARLREILTTHRSIFAAEMEVAGVYEAAQGIDHQYPVMAIRGISDIIGLQRDRRWTEYACQTAAAFTYAFIMADPLPPLNSASFQRPAVSSTPSSAQLPGSQSTLDTQMSQRQPRIPRPEKKKKRPPLLLVVSAVLLLMVFGGAILALHVISGGRTFSETTGGNANTWTNYSNGGGNPGQVIPSHKTVQIACKVIGLKVKDGDTWWYRIASSPWDNKYYVSADAFYNNGQTSGPFTTSLPVDNKVPNC
jgi:nucleoside phosphorylase